MKEEEEYEDDIKQSCLTPSIPFSNFYITKRTPSNCSGSHYKLSEQLTNPSSKN